ncbi:hypothetical protein B0537_14630 [Desulforamulus ferrireducens]|uniref:Uncharacterized protein n=2 Tax=Desulforamulus ferrireducens TaxID=1833852 RepID=A0A1S6IZK0_9FIRM|nr:hypothetical protein B0537_14630 [Desulforamulus ferrireducens]
MTILPILITPVTLLYILNKSFKKCCPRVRKKAAPEARAVLLEEEVPYHKVGFLNNVPILRILEPEKMSNNKHEIVAEYGDDAK